MNAVGGRQAQRSSMATAHHHRQHSDNFLEASSNKWLQSAGLHHLQSSSNSPFIPALQDFNFYGGGGAQNSRLSRNALRSGNGGAADYSTDPSTPPVASRSSNTRRISDHVSPNEHSPGLLDLHSVDTELLPEMSIPSLYDVTSIRQHARGRSFDDSESYLSTSKQTGRVRGTTENPLLRSTAIDKEKASSVAKIKVVVRKRPLNRREIAKKEDDIISIESSSSSLTVHETKLKVDLTEYIENHAFVYDAVLNEGVSNDEVYSETVEPIVPIIFQRTKATCFAYGQTGSGKTYTMQPLPIKASHDILRLMRHTYHNQGFHLFVSFFEIYGGKLFDLLNDRKKLCMREDGKQQVCIVGLQEYKVLNVETIKELIEKGNASRSTGTTGANEESSRSHAILQLAIKRYVDGNESKPARLVGKLSFIDLAGSERGADTTDNDKQTRMEGAEINKSLLALKECIRALDNDQGHIPFRGSKLTEVLRDSFVGDSRTVMISCISPSSGSCEHTLNTLRYADRVKSLSKGNSSRKDLPSLCSNPRDSTTMLSQTSRSMSSTGDLLNEKNRFGLPKELEGEASIPFNMERVPSGKADTNFLVSAYSDHFTSHQSQSQSDILERELDCSQTANGSWMMNIAEQYSLSALDEKIRSINIHKMQKDLAGYESQPDDDLNALLEEEEDLVFAHRKQVEETIDIIREEMNLLVEADKPGNDLDDYITKLNAVLCHKAEGISQLQIRLAHFQKLLKEHDVFISPSNH